MTMKSLQWWRWDDGVCMADCCRLELRQLERHGCQQSTVWCVVRLNGWYLLTTDQAGQRRRQEVTNITVHCHEQVCKWAPRLIAAHVLWCPASAVSPTHQRSGRKDTDDRWVVPPHWAPTVDCVPGRLRCKPALHCLAVVQSRVYQSHYKHLERGCWECLFHASSLTTVHFRAVVTTEH